MCTEKDLVELCRDLKSEWEDLKSDPLREVVAVWIARVLRRLHGTDFRSEAEDVALWLYHDGTPRVDRSVWYGFDQLVTQCGFPGLHDWGNAQLHRGSGPIDFRSEAEDDARYAACVRWAEHHASDS